jgi:hypothetical protein
MAKIDGFKIEDITILDYLIYNNTMIKFTDILI